MGSKAPGYVEKISSRRTSFLTIGSTEADVVASTVQLCKGCVPHHSQIHVPHHKRRFGRQTGSGRRGRIRVWIGKGSCSCNRDCGHMRELIMVHSFYLTVAVNYKRGRVIYALMRSKSGNMGIIQKI